MGKKKNWLKHVRYLNLAFSIGISMVLIILLGVFGGDWLDRRLGTSPIFLLLGIFLGVGIGFYNLWNELSRLNNTNIKRKLAEEKQNSEIIKNKRIGEGKSKKQ